MVIRLTGTPEGFRHNSSGASAPWTPSSSASGANWANARMAVSSAARRSSRTGQTHSLGGFVGKAEYQGDLTEFVPYLRAAQWTGVGRQTAWGKGEFTLYTERSS